MPASAAILAIFTSICSVRVTPTMIELTVNPVPALASARPWTHAAHSPGAVDLAVAALQILLSAGASIALQLQVHR